MEDKTNQTRPENAYEAAIQAQDLLQLPIKREISWEEALGTIVAKLEEIRGDPKRLHIQAWEITGDIMHWLSALGSAFGTPHIMRAASPTCGKVIHPVEFFSGGGFHQQPDLHYCN